METPPGAPRSADGAYWWDGTAWQPVGAGAPPRRRRMPALAWVGIGCAGLIALGVVAFIGCGVVAFTSAHCPPSDFPVPAGATLGGTHVFSGTGGSTCDSQWNVPESGEQTSAFYGERLRTGDWDFDGQDASSGVIQFHRRGRPDVKGQLELLTHGDQTEVRLHMTALTPNFGR